MIRRLFPPPILVVAALFLWHVSWFPGVRLVSAFVPSNRREVVAASWSCDETAHHQRRDGGRPTKTQVSLASETSPSSQPGRCRVIGIAGASGAGKSSLAASLVSHFTLPAPPISLDAFYTGQRTSLTEDRARADVLSAWETPEVFDMEAMQGAILEHRQAGCDSGSPFVVAEGFLLFARPGLRDMIDLPVFLDITEQESLARRLRRGDDGCSEEILRLYHRKHTWPAYLKYKASSRLPKTTLVLPADKTKEEILSRVVAWLPS